MSVIEERTSPDGKKSYRVKIRLRGHPPESKTFNRKTDAKIWAKNTETAIRSGQYFKQQEAKKHTLSELFDRYIDEVIPQRPKTAGERNRHLRWWKKHLGHHLLADVTAPVIKTHQSKLKKEKTERGKIKSDATVNRYLATLSHVFSTAVNEWHWMDDNPMRKVKKFRESNGRVRYLSDDERSRLLSACKESRSKSIYPVVVLAFATGMRFSEIIDLTWQEVDFKTKKIILNDTKNNERRSVPLVGHPFEVLKDYSKVRSLETDLVFPSNHEPLKPIDLRTPWSTALKKSGITDFRFHDLRHCAASYLAMNGASLADIATILGYKTLAMAKRYTHLCDSHTSGVVEKMNKNIFG